MGWTRCHSGCSIWGCLTAVASHGAADCTDHPASSCILGAHSPTGSPSTVHSGDLRSSRFKSAAGAPAPPASSPSPRRDDLDVGALVGPFQRGWASCRGDGARRHSTQSTTPARTPQYLYRGTSCHPHHSGTLTAGRWPRVRRAERRRFRRRSRARLAQHPTPGRLLHPFLGRACQRTSSSRGLFRLIRRVRPRDCRRFRYARNGIDPRFCVSTLAAAVSAIPSATAAFASLHREW